MVAGGTLERGTLRRNPTSSSNPIQSTPSSSSSRSKSTLATSAPIPRRPLPVPATTLSSYSLFPQPPHLTTPTTTQVQISARREFAAQLAQLQHQAATRNAPPMSEHPAFKGMTPQRAFVGTDDVEQSMGREFRETSTTDESESLGESERGSDKLYVHTWSSTKTTPATSAGTTPEKGIQAQTQVPGSQVRRKPLPRPAQAQSQTQYKPFPSPNQHANVTSTTDTSSAHVTADPIALAASRAAALRIKRKSIPRPISILPPLRSEIQRLPAISGSAQAKPLFSATSAGGRTPWTAKYGANSSLRTPRTGASHKSALRSGRGRYADLPTPARTPVEEKRGPPSDFEYAKQLYQKHKERKYEEKRSAAIESAKERKSTDGRGGAPTPTHVPKTPRTPRTAAMEKRGTDGDSGSRTPLSSRLLSFGSRMLRTPKTASAPKTPKTPKSSGFRRPSMFVSRSRAGSVNSKAGPKTPRTPFTPFGLKDKASAIFTSLRQGAGTASSETAAELEETEAWRARMKAAIGRPHDDGRVFAADAFDPAVSRRREEMPVAVPNYHQPQQIVLGVSADGERRQTTISEFIDAGMGRHPLLQQPQAPAQQPARLTTPFLAGMLNAARQSSDSIHTSVSTGTTSSKGKAKDNKGKGKSGTADRGHMKQKPSLMSKISDFSSTHLQLSRKPSTASDMSFACAGIEDLGDAESDTMAQARVDSRCRVCGVPAFGMQEGLCEACSHGTDGFLESRPWPHRDASLPRQREGLMPSAPHHYRSSSLYTDPGNPFKNDLPFKRTLDPHGSIGVWDSDSWLDTESEKMAKEAAKNAGESSRGREPVGRDTGFYRFYDELLVSPVARVL